MRSEPRRLIFMLAALTAAAFVQAQSNAVGFVYGAVKSDDYAPVANARVELVQPDTGITRSVTTTVDGRFRFPSVSVGNYKLQAFHADYPGQRPEPVRVSLGKGSNIELMLEPAAEIEEIVVVGDRYSRVDLATTETSTTITKAMIDEMPIQRSTTDVALLTPGTLRGDSAFGFLASFGGSSVAENVYYVNGMNVTDFRNGLGHSFAPFDFYDEYEVKTGGFSAEFGRSTGGVVNAVTKRGSNEWGFGGKVIYTPNRWSSNSPNVLLDDGTLFINNDDVTSDTVRRSVYASGPILRDKVFFYAMYAPAKIDRTNFNPNTVTVTDGDNPYWGLKLDFWLTDNHLLEFTGFGDEREGQRRTFDYDAANNLIGEERGVIDYVFGGSTAIARYTGYLTPSLSVSALVGRNINEGNDKSPLDDNPVIVDFREFPPLELGNWVNFRAQRSKDEREVLRFDVDWQLGDHHLRAGLDVELNNSFELTTMSGGEYWAYESVNPGDPVNDGMGTVVPPGVNDIAVHIIWDNGGSFDLESRAYYLQDIWRMTDDLTFNLGLRHETFKNKNAVGETFLKIDDQWAPRLGVAWDFLGSGRSKLFATAGRYHLPMPSTVNLLLAGGDTYREDYYPLAGLHADDTPILGDHFATFAPSDGSVPDTRASVDQTIEPMYQDELIVGYVTALGEHYNAGIRAIYRKLGRAIEDIEVSPVLNDYADENGFDSFFAPPFSAYALANPGSDMHLFIDMDGDGNPDFVELSAVDIGMPKAKRNYRALELFFERRWEGVFFYHLSYTLSESKGNHEGYVKSDNGQADPGFTANFDYPGLVDGAYGPLPNDRRHSLKAYGSWEFLPDWQAGINAYWISGRPLNAFGFHPTDFLSAAYGAASFYHDGKLVPRGGAGRTPSVVNFDVSLQYRRELGNGLRFRATAQVFNVLNADGVLERRESTADFFGQPDPAFGLPTFFQDARFARLSLAVDFGG